MGEGNFEREGRNPEILLEEIKRLTDLYRDTEADAKNFPEVKRTLRENLSMLVKKVKEIDPNLVPEEAEKILTEAKEEKNNPEE